MQSPCRTCAKKDQDFGGCRCQAYLLTGDATNADPVCSLSPFRDTIEHAVTPNETEISQAMVFRNTANSKKLS